MSLFPVGEWALAHLQLAEPPEPVLLMGMSEAGDAIVVHEDGSISKVALALVRIDFRLIEGAWKDLEDVAPPEGDGT